jgi:hypothetical protein
MTEVETWVHSGTFCASGVSPGRSIAEIGVATRPADANKKAITVTTGQGVIQTRGSQFSPIDAN